MDLKDNFLISDDVGYFFDESFSFPNDSILKITLRYIALKCCNSDLANLKPILLRYIYTLHSINNLSLNDDTFKVFLFNQNGVETQELIKHGFNKLNNERNLTTEYLSRTSPTSIFINEEKQKAIVIVDKITEKWVTDFSSVLFRILLWHFPDGKQLDEQDKNFFNAVSKRNAFVINDISKSFDVLIDFAAERQRKHKNELNLLLADWGNDAYKALVTNFEKSVENLKRELENKRIEFTNILDELNKNNIQLSALLCCPLTNSNSVFKFFEMNKQLEIINVKNNNHEKNLTYIINETIEFFDEDSFLKQFKNENSYLFKYSKTMQDLMYGLFIENKGKLKTRCAFTLSGLTSITPVYKHDFGDDKILPHPHIDMGTCLGNNASIIQNFLAKGNWEMAIMQTIAATKNIYFSDIGVIQKMMTWLEYKLNSSNKYIVADNGCEMSINDFLSYLKETH